MPDTIRKRCGQETHPWRGRFGQACIVGALPLTSNAACAEPRPTLRPVTDYIDAFTALEGHELAALALTLGVILFAVATAFSAVTASFVRVGGSPSGVHRHRLPIA